MWRQVMGGGAGPTSSPWLIAEQWKARSFTMPKWRAAAARECSACSSRGRHGATANDSALFQKETYWYCFSYILKKERNKEEVLIGLMSSSRWHFHLNSSF
jgi:hypothetical protein